MADELTSPTVAPQTPSAPAEQAPAVSTTEPRPEQPVSSPPARTSDNWQDDPKFKEYQRNYNKALERERVERQRLEQQAQQRIFQLEQQIEQFATRDLSEEELSKREQMKLHQLLQRKDEEMKALQQEYAKDLAKNEIARRAKVDVNLFSDVDNPDDAWELALHTREQQIRSELEAYYKEKLAAQPGNTPDLGSGKPVTPATTGPISKFSSDADLRETYRRLWDEYND